MIKPNRLKKGDKVAIVSLSRGLLGEDKYIHILDIAKERLENEMQLAYEVYSSVASQLPMARAKVQEELGFKLTKTRNILLQLEQEGKIERHGNARSVFYTVSK